MGYGVRVSLLLIPAIVACVFLLPLAMARLEPTSSNSPTHRAAKGRAWGNGRRTETRS
jgi:hypothetical protein